MDNLPIKRELPDVKDSRNFEDQFCLNENYFYDILWSLRIKKDPVISKASNECYFLSEGRTSWEASLSAKCSRRPPIDFRALNFKVFNINFTYNNVTHYGQAIFNGFELVRESDYFIFNSYFQGVGELISYHTASQIKELELLRNKFPQEYPPFDSGQLALPNPDRKDLK